MITVTIYWFSVLADIRGVRKEQQTLEQPVNGEQLFDRLAKQHTQLLSYRDHIRLALNREYVPLDTAINEGDEVVFITPVSGG